MGLDATKPLNQKEKFVKEKVYLETTVISYLTARPSRDIIIIAHQQVTLDWWENVLPKLSLFISPIVIEEVSR